MTEMIDSVARSRLDAHEKFCEERARNAETFEHHTRSSFNRMHQRLDKVLWGVATNIIMIVIGAAGFLFVKVMGW